MLEVEHKKWFRAKKITTINKKENMTHFNAKTKIGNSSDICAISEIILH